MLNERQKAFADYYLECGNASEAARRAGYKAENADVTGPRLLGNVGISSYIDEHLKAASEKRIASAEQVMEFYTRVMCGEEKDQFGLEASLDTRISAAREIMKRHAAATDRNKDTYAKLDKLLEEFRNAVDG